MTAPPGPVGVVGAGTMGAGIAQLALEAGHQVWLHDVDAAAIERGRARIRNGLERRAGRLDLDADSAESWVDGRLARLHDAQTLDVLAASGPGLVVEAALEDLEAKRAIFWALDTATPPSAILATNTSALSVGAIGAATAHRERVIGLHFFNPAPVMPLVEVVAPSASDPSIVDRATALMTAWGKVPVRCRDTPGFIVNRVNRPFTLEALAMLAAGEASVVSIDAAMRADGFPMGPFELMDLVGIDINLAAARGVYAGSIAAGDPLADRFRPSPIQERLVAEGRLGRKTRRRFLPLRGRPSPSHPAPSSTASRRAASLEGAEIAGADRARCRQRGLPGVRRRASPPRPTSTSRCASAPTTRAARSNAPRRSAARRPSSRSSDRTPRPARGSCRRPPSWPRPASRYHQSDDPRDPSTRSARPGSSRPSARRSVATAARSRASGRTTWLPPCSAPSSIAPVSIPALVEDVILGCANQAGEDNRNVARMALLLADFPVEVGGQTVNRLCGSGLQAINSAAHAIAVGDGDVFIGGGVESMTRAPYVQLKAEGPWDRGPREMADTTLGWRFVNPRLAERHYPYSMGETAENVAERWGVSRERQDAFALESQQRAVAAIEAGRFADQIVPISVPQRKGDPLVIDRDEHPRADTTAEALAPHPSSLPARGRHGHGRQHLGHQRRSRRRSCSSRRTVPATLGLRPLARVVSTAVAGVDPAVMGVGPVPATRKALERAGIGVEDLDLIELNEAFASQSLVCIDELGLDPARVNVNGGAIALGHPLGMSGGRLITMLTHELRRTGGRYGLATMCIGVGQGIATIVERLDG